MNIKVSKDRIKINNETLIHKGEYKTNELEFSFSDEYSGLSKMAVFTKDDKSYNVAIVNNKCYIPTEVLTDDTDITFGVFGYDTENDEIVKRYSPSPVKLTINTGSYEENAITPIDNVEPTDFEEFVEQINTNKQDKLTAGTNITIDENNVISATGGGSGGTTNYNDLTNKPQINGVNLSGNKTTSDLGINIPTKTSDLTNDSGFITSYTETDPTVPAHVKSITQNEINDWNSKGAVRIYGGVLNLVDGTAPTDLLNNTHYYINGLNVNGTYDDAFSFSLIFHWVSGDEHNIDLISKYTKCDVPFTIGKRYKYTNGVWSVADENKTTTSISSSSTDKQIPTAKAVYNALPTVPTIATSITSSSTNSEVAGAKATYDLHNEVSFIVCALTSTHRITISQAWSSGAQSVPLDSITLSGGSDYSLNNGKIKVGSKPKVIELSICISPYSLDGDANVTYQGIIRRIRNGTKTNLLNLAMYPYNINKSCYYSGSVITTCEENDEFELALGTSSPTKTVDSGTSANALTIKTLSKVALSQTRTLNAPLMNTGSLVGMGDRADIGIIEDKSDITTENKGSGDEI